MSFLFPSSTITIEAALRDLGSGSPKARVHAAHALGDVTDPVAKGRAIDALIRALNDDRPEVRAEACAALGQLGDPAPVRDLVKRLDDGIALVRQNAAIALGCLANPDGFAPLAKALQSGPPDLRFQAATSLAEIDPARAFEHVVAAVEDRDPHVSSAAALAIGAIASERSDLAPRAVAALVPKLNHADPCARFDVAYALAEIGDASGREVLSAALVDPERSWDAVTALAKIGAGAELERAVASRNIAREAATLAAGRLLARAPESERARQVLIDALGARALHIRGIAVEQLAEVGGSWATLPLEKLARSRKGATLREAIANALHQIGIRP